MNLEGRQGDAWEEGKGSPLLWKSLGASWSGCLRTSLRLFTKKKSGCPVSLVEMQGRGTMQNLLSRGDEADQFILGISFGEMV